jgi:hypothetical protein
VEARDGEAGGWGVSKRQHEHQHDAILDDVLMLGAVCCLEEESMVKAVPQGCVQ